MRPRLCRSNRLRTASLALVLLVCHAPALRAAGLGEARPLSALGEPLRVGIDLMLEPGERLDEIQIRVSSPSVDSASGAAAGSAVTASAIATAEEGKANVLVRSRTPVFRPYVELFVAVSSPAGHSDRNFVVPLPPVRPGIAVPSPSAAVTANSAISAAPSPAAVAAPTPQPAAPPLHTEPAPAAPAPAQGMPLPSQTATPLRRQAVGKIAPSPTAPPPDAEANRTSQARTAHAGPPAESRKSDGTVLIKAIGDSATVIREGPIPGTTQSKTYGIVIPEEDEEAAAKPH